MAYSMYTKPLRGTAKGYIICMKKTIIHLLACAFLASACASAPKTTASQRDEDYYNQGMAQMETKFYSEALKNFEDLRDKFPLSPYSVLALLRMGECQFLDKNYIEAQYQFDNFRRLHPSHAQVDYAMFMAGMCQFRQILDYDRDQTASLAAVKQLEMLVEVFPNSPYSAKALCKIAEAKKHIAEYEFFVGSFYLKKNNYLGAYTRFDKLLLQYPNSIERDRVLLAMGKTCLYDGQTDKGKRILQLLLLKYPDGACAADAEKLLAMY